MRRFAPALFTSSRWVNRSAGGGRRSRNDSAAGEESMYARSTRAAVLSARGWLSLTRRSQAARRGQIRRIQAVGRARARTEAKLNTRSDITRSVSTHMTRPQQQQPPPGAFGSLDCESAGDHDQPSQGDGLRRAYGNNRRSRDFGGYGACILASAVPR